MSWVIRDGRRIYCFEAGEGRPVVLLHGMGLAGIAWSPQVPALIAAGFRVIVPDMAGHGASDAPNRPIGVPDLVLDLVSVMDARDVAQADLVGVSMGGTTALAMAASEPQRVGRLVVANAGPSTDQPEFEQMLSGWADTLRSDNGPLGLLKELWPFLVCNDFAESTEGQRAFQHWSAANASVAGDGMANVLQGAAGYEGDDALGLIEAPTLFIGGSEDPVAKLVRQLPERVWDARYVEIEGAKHFANADRAEEFTRRLIRFLA